MSERFVFHAEEYGNGYGVFDTEKEITNFHFGAYSEAERLCKLLNKLIESSKYWREECLILRMDEQILYMELSIAMDKGYELSEAYKNYKEKRSCENE